jgi:arylsulfatase
MRSTAGKAALLAMAVAGSMPARAAVPVPAWPADPAPAAGAPNVLLIMTDDVGFASSSTFGGPVPTPNFGKLAAEGARYNQFNTTALCSPSRAALLTGRNPHRVGMGTLPDIPRPYPGYTGVIPKSAGTIARILKDAGYNTAAFGKWHLAPRWELSQAGPVDRWPTGLGFEHYYGFLGGDTSQWEPALYDDTRPIEAPHDDPGYILDRDLADHAIGWMRQQHALAPAKPFFIYYATGSAHAPHQAPAEWLARFRGEFDQGWDKVREESFARQKAMGIIPRSAALTPRPAELPAWKSLSADQRRLFARLMEAYAAQLAYSDFQIGRVIDELRRSGQWGNTLIIFIQGDNGSSAEGGLRGMVDEGSFVEGIEEPLDYQLAHIDEIGGPRAYNSYPAGWAWAMDTPFQYYKQIASHLGGTRNGLVIAWPGHIDEPRTVRTQFHFIADILPTIAEAARVPLPTSIDGVRQLPFDGISMAYSFRHPREASHRREQLFEMVGNMGLYKDGWWANTTPIRQPWDLLKPAPADAEGRPWQLFDLTHDYSQAHDLAKADPGRLAAMKAEFMAAAEANNLLPFRDDPAPPPPPKPTLGAERTEFIYYPGMTRIAEDAAPHTIGRSWRMEADVEIGARAHGVIATHGGRFGGYGFYLRDGCPVFRYNAIGSRAYTVAADRPLAPGRHRLALRFASDGGPGSGGLATIEVDGAAVASGRIEHSLAAWISLSEGLDIGEDTISPIDDDYTIATSRFSGKIGQVRFILD